MPCRIFSQKFFQKTCSKNTVNLYLCQSIRNNARNPVLVCVASDNLRKNFYNLAEKPKKDGSSMKKLQHVKSPLESACCIWQKTTLFHYKKVCFTLKSSPRSASSLIEQLVDVTCKTGVLYNRYSTLSLWGGALKTAKNGQKRTETDIGAPQNTAYQMVCLKSSRF